MVLVSMSMTVLFGFLAIGLRSLIHARRTRSSPFRSGAGVGAPIALAGNTIALLAGPVVQISAAPALLVHGTWPKVIGVTLAAMGLAGTLWAQLAMGESWRIGVDPSEQTTLVTGGPFRLVRNPIYTAMIVFAAGLALLVPNAVSLLMLLGVIASLEAHVRRVEEPVLLRAHGEPYRTYAARTGRFLPGIGRSSVDSPA
jgi:protein-S-isoprenylcysteine O-methyltransferase Ste14